MPSYSASDQDLSCLQSLPAVPALGRNKQVMSTPSKMSEDLKWDCEYCTYKNFPVSRKCVLCHAQRPLQVISDLENSEQDIYKVAEIEARNSENFVSNKDLEKKWECSLCTFTNPVSALKCSQCQESRKQTRSPLRQPQDLTKPLAVRTQPTSVGSPFPPGQSSKVSPSSPSTSNSRRVGDSARISTCRGKWGCNACTYENYPQSKLCTMCRTPRGNTSVAGESAPTSSAADFALHVDTKNQENIRSGQSSPNIGPNETVVYKAGSPDQSSPPNNRSSQSSPVNNKSVSGQAARANTSGQTSPNNRSSPNSPNYVNINQDPVIPYKSNSGQNSPNNPVGQTSPKGNRSGQVSPQENSSGQNSPSGVTQGSPLIARASRDSVNRNRNKLRNEAFIINDGTGAFGGTREEDVRERRLHKLRRKLTTEDLVWLKACESVVSGDPSGIEQFLASGGDPARQLTKDEVLILNRPSAFEVGYTLVHLALRFRQDDMVAILLTATDISSKGFKRLPSYTSPDLSADIRREVSVMLRQRKGSFACYFLTECATFSLPAEIEDLPRHVHEQLFDEILDGDVDKELTDDLVVNWSVEITEKLSSRLYALWNRTAGDCLLDSVLQATWGILDIDNTLRRALSDSLLEGAMSFYPKWKEYETMQAHLLNFSLDEDQWQRDWALLLSLASQPGTSLEQMHIFALAHILRRPVIVYGVKVVKSFRGESIDFARFEGVYLPLLWERSFCWKSPIALGYTRGHFSALVTMEVDTDIPMGAGAGHVDHALDNDEQIAYLPLVDHDGSFLPIHFVTGSEIGQEETTLRKWLDCLVTQEGLFVAIQKIGKRPPLVKQMMEVWLDHYRHQAHFTDDGEPTSHPTQNFSSDGESDQE